MNTKTLLSVAAISLGSMTGAIAADKTSDATGGDSTYTDINYQDKNDHMQSSTMKPKDEIPSFTTADTDKNGYVNKDEFESAQMDQDFDDVDTNADGKVSEREMNNAITMY
ncbi:MAG: hypothetical protein VX185_16990 [Pseudomonadota bacterium]|nr:hypothetical protein [Pseudomonadota bacterium]